MRLYTTPLWASHTLLLIYRELNILCVKYSLYTPYDDDVIIQDGASNGCPLPPTYHPQSHLYKNYHGIVSKNLMIWSLDTVINAEKILLYQHDRYCEKNNHNKWTRATLG